MNPIIFLIIGLFFASCKSNNEIPEDEIIAKVGDRIITTDEFKSSFEFSFSPTRTGENPREVYLDYMIKEMLIANEGYTQGFNYHKYVTDRVSNRTKNNLLEAFYTNHVYSQVNVPEEIIIDALKKASIKFRLLIWPTPSLEKAAEAYDAANESDLGDYIEKEINKLEVKNVDKRNYETDWFDYLDMRPEVFAEIQNLEMGKPSKPIPYNGGYAIFQVFDINRDAIKSDELISGARRKKIEARLFNIESDSIIHVIMDSVLTPLNVRVSSKTIDMLVRPLYSWVEAGIPKRASIVGRLKAVTDTSQSYLIELNEMLPLKLFSSVDGITTVEDYFNYMNYHRKIINNSANAIDLKNRLLTEVGTMIKNNKFISIAKNEGNLDSSKIIKDIEVWEEKWTYDIFRDNLIKDIKIADDEMKQFFKERWSELRISNVDTTRFYKYETDVYNFLMFEKHSALLKDELTKLKKQYPVWINKEVLNKLELNDGPKSHETSLFVTKNFSGKALVPIVDMQWLNY